eukprot:4128451-Prymnesium_polylepis.1
MLAVHRRYLSRDPLPPGRHHVGHGRDAPVDRVKRDIPLSLASVTIGADCCVEGHHNPPSTVSRLRTA